MARTPATFKQADLTRAVKAARACGLAIERTEITADGRIILVHHKSAPEPTNDFDKWKEKRNARSA
jgi:hypothetical protein